MRICANVYLVVFQKGLGCLGKVRAVASTVIRVSIFLDSLVSLECRCGAIGFPLRAERMVEVRRSFLCFRGLIVVWDGFVQSFDPS